MGFFSSLGRQARLNAGYINAQADFHNLQKLGVSRIDPIGFNNRALDDTTLNHQGSVLLDKGKGYAQQAIEDAYGLNSADALNVVNAGRQYVSGDYEGNALLKQRLRNNLNKGNKATKPKAGVDYYKNLLNNKLNKAPDNKRMAGDLPPSFFNTVEAQRLGDKDFRNELVNREVEVARQFFPEDASRFDIIDALQDIDARRGPMMAEALRNDPEIQRILQKEEMGGYVRAAKPEGFVGEGMFGQVKEFAPGYVIKSQDPVVEWPPLGDDRGYYLHDARDVAAEVRDLRQLEGLGISPKVEAFDINPDGSTEVVYRDLRDNYDTLDTVSFNLDTQMRSAGSEQERTKLTNKARALGLKNVQQQVMANERGLKLNDRHAGNIMVNKMSGRPMQIDISASPLSGLERDSAMATNAVLGLKSAGLTEESEILDGLLREAFERKDAEAFHDLTQQGVSRLMKLKGYQEVPTAADLMSVPF